MNINEIKQILSHNPTNKYIVSQLDDNTFGMIADILSNVEAKDFKEINPEGQFDFTDIPIPHEMLEKKENSKPIKRSQEIEEEIKKLHDQINKEGTNLEYPYVFDGKENQISNIEKMPAGASQACNYDWNYINNLIKNQDNTNITLFHTHPKPSGQEHNTLYSKYPEKLSALGVKPQGLNLSVADIYAQMYVDKLIKDNGKNITAQSTVLMHDGSLVSFSTQQGLALTEDIKLKQNKEQQNQNQNEQSINSQPEIQENDFEEQEVNDLPKEQDFPEVIETPQNENSQALESTEPKVESIPLEELKKAQIEALPEVYSEEAQQILIENFKELEEQNKNQEA